MSDRGAALREYRKKASAKLNRVMKNWYKVGPRNLIQKMADMMAEDQLTSFEAGADHERQECAKLIDPGPYYTVPVPCCIGTAHSVRRKLMEKVRNRR